MASGFGKSSYLGSAMHVSDRVITTTPSFVSAAAVCSDGRV